MVFIESNYTGGTKEPDINAYILNSSFANQKTDDRFDVKIIEILGLQALAEDDLDTVHEIIARNNAGNTSVSWEFDPGDGTVISNTSISLNQSESIIILVQNSYGGFLGVYPTNATVNSSSESDNAQSVAVVAS